MLIGRASLDMEDGLDELLPRFMLGDAECAFTIAKRELGEMWCQVVCLPAQAVMVGVARPFVLCLRQKDRTSV